MSISNALNNAITGLSANGRAAQTVSNNLSNALTDGYARRELEVSAREGGGVRIDAEVRILDRVALGDRRFADADVSRGSAQLGFLTAAQDRIGEPGSGQALSDRVTELETALIAAAVSPSSNAVLEQTVTGFKRLATQLADTSGAIQQERMRADANISEAVGQLNSDLGRIERLNLDIQAAVLRGGSGGALLDERQRTIDRVSALIQVREVARDNGAVALMGESGVVLDGPAPTIGFTASGIITENMSLAGGTLSGLTFNGAPLDLARDKHALSGGQLEGLFEVRDRLAPQAQARLDGFARDLIERFEAPGVDTTIGPTDPAILTDGGLRFDPANEVGLSRRLAVNAAVDPAVGGEAWRLRDGMGAAGPGDVGMSAGIARLGEALSIQQSPVSGGFDASSRTSAGLAAAVLTSVSTLRDATEADIAGSRARSTALTERLQADGVDSDAEMQRLMLIEQAYAANAKVISAAQAMLDMLMEI